MSRTPTLPELKAFLRSHYRRDRFEGRDGAWCPDYSDRVTANYLSELRERGEASITRHESASGAAVCFGPDLVVRP